MLIILVVSLFVVVLAAFVVARSLRVVGPSEIGLVNKRFARRSLADGNPVALHGEAGYQAALLMPGLRFKLWPVYTVSKHPWVQVPAGELGVVIAQVGDPIAIGAKSAEYREAFGNFSDLGAFLSNGGQKGVQRPVLPPGTLVPIHPAAFLVITASRVYGAPVSSELQSIVHQYGGITPEVFGLQPQQLQVTVIAPNGSIDMVGVVTALEGEPLPSGDIASRLGGFDDVHAMEADGATDAEIIDTLLGRKNELHNNYQDFQAFLAHGGRIGLQHDPLLYGAYLLNPFLVRVELVPMLVVNQGQVAVVKSFVGLPTIDTSGQEFKFGSIVAPGHRGIWREPLRTGKYPINPRCYAAEIVPTSIITLNWANASSQAHNLDAHLSPIEGKSREGFIFTIDLQVQIHVPDTRAPKVISMVGTMMNLVNEVLQSAVGNHFRNTLQRLEAIKFIETRHEVQSKALEAITEYLNSYQVETRGVYIQDVQFPDEMVKVLTTREIANQEKATFEEQQRAELARIDMEKARGTADMQSQLASSQVGITIEENQAAARVAQAKGEAEAVRALGSAEGERIRSIGSGEADALRAQGLARAEGFEAQRAALGEAATAAVNIVDAIARGDVKVMPDVLVAGGGGGPFEALAAALTQMVRGGGTPAALTPSPASAPAPDRPADDAAESSGAAPAPAAQPDPAHTEAG